MKNAVNISDCAVTHDYPRQGPFDNYRLTVVHRAGTGPLGVDESHVDKTLGFARSLTLKHREDAHVQRALSVAVESSMVTAVTIFHDSPHLALTFKGKKRLVGAMYLIEAEELTRPADVHMLEIANAESAGKYFHKRLYGKGYCLVDETGYPQVEDYEASSINMGSVNLIWYQLEDRVNLPK